MNPYNQICKYSLEEEFVPLFRVEAFRM